jgi:predicted RNA binding protein YcfA (HicA-like mRNA interferase family)
MGRLSGFSYRDIIKRLKLLGFAFFRQGAGSHEIWYNVDTDRFTTVVRHNFDMPEGTLRAVLKQADISVDDFLNAR